LAALVNTAHGEAASKIKQLDQHYIAHKIAHAVAGCAAAAANKGKCQDGAIGAAVGEIVGEALVKNTDFSGMTPEQLDLEVKKITAYAKLAAGTVAGVTGGDVNTAAQTAQNAVENNAVKAVVTAAKVVYKVAKKGLKNGRINVKDLKQTLKDEGYSLVDNLITLSDGTLDWNDAKAVIDIVVGTELNKANRGEAAQKIKETLNGSKQSGMRSAGKNAAAHVTIRKHYTHHKEMVDDVKTQLKAQGYSVSSREITFKDGFANGRTRPDIIARSPDNKLVIYEIKTGNAQLSIRQSEIYPQIRDGNAIPKGDVASKFGLISGKPLKDQGYPNGIPIIVKNFPGAK
ncbi:VENN motif pre-toxin domain-containing protein, partial [Neisseria sp. N95_16]|uniref:VENN motif pre-toxin domain-containing protein n=1 Tax=Neisseria sp. N95_16 TaxID=2024408 RepID=UPI001E51D061